MLQKNDKDQLEEQSDQCSGYILYVHNGSRYSQTTQALTLGYICRMEWMDDGDW